MLPPTTNGLQGVGSNSCETRDFHEMLLFHQTDPESPFTHDRLCTMVKPWGRITLSGNKLTKSTYLKGNKGTRWKGECSK